MLNLKFVNDFKELNKNNVYISTIDTIVEQEKMYGDILSWDKQTIIKVFNDMHYTGINRLINSLALFKSFIGFIADKESKNCNIDEYNIEPYDLVDLDTFFATVFTPLQIKNILKQLDKNVRDRVPIELADACLSEGQIRNLKESDIEYKNNQYDMEVAFVTVRDEETDEVQKFKIEDQRTVQDLHLCMKTFDYFIESSDSKLKKFQLKNSPYLIKPVNVGRSSKDDRISNVTTALKASLRANNVQCDGIDIENVTIDNIKRSKLIYMLSPSLIRKNQSSKELVASILGNKYSNTVTLKFYEEMAAIKYPDNK